MPGPLVLGDEGLEGRHEPSRGVIAAMHLIKCYPPVGAGFCRLRSSHLGITSDDRGA
jgi:hypothetical protein